MCCDPEPYRDHCDGVGVLVTQEDGDGVAEDEEDHQLNEGGRFRMSLFFLLDEQETMYTELYLQRWRLCDSIVRR